MRVSTNGMYDLGTSAMLQQQDALIKTQQQISTGRRILTPADDPIAAAQALGVSQASSINTQYSVNRDHALASLGLVETTLENISSNLQGIRQITVNAGNPTLTDTDRKSLATELRGRFEALLGQANITDGTGNHLFSGFQESTQPFTNKGLNVQYNGDQGQRLSQVGPTRQIAVSNSGTDIFERIKNGNGIFTTTANTSNTGTGVINSGSVTAPASLTGHNYEITFTVSGGVTTYDIVNTTSGTTLSTGNSFANNNTINFDGLQLSITGDPANGDKFTVSPSTNQSIFTTIGNLITALETPVTSQPGEQSPEQKAKLETEGSEEMEAGRMPESEEQAQQKGVEPSEKPSSPEKSEGSPKEKGVEKEKRKASGEGPKAPAEEADTEQIRIEKETAGLEETPTAAGEKRAEGEPESSEADKGEGISETLEAEAQKRDQKQLAPEQKAKEALEPEQKAKKKRKPSSRKKKEELEPEVSPLPEAEKGRSRERKYKAFGELPQGTTYYIRNAGVVLLHAFLPTYFRAIKLVEGASFVNEAAHHKAAHLIQYLAAREEGLPEYELLLPKFLCGLPFDIPLEREVEILETEKEEGENLLKAAIQHWGALGDASPDGLREGFLRRDGKLEKRQNGWYLMVEQKTLDILLGKLPWNLSLVKLPWMPDMLRVEWAK